MKILQELKEAGKTLTLAHHNADIDAVGAAIAIHEFLGPENDLGVPDSVSRGARELSEGYDFKVNPGLDEYDLVLILDCPSKEQLEPIDVENFQGKKLLVDHHSEGNLKEIVDKSWIEPEARSSSEMAYELLGEENINRKSAEALICGMVADTSHLKLAKEKHFEYISKLLPKTGKEYSEVLSVIHTSIDFSERVAKIKACERTEAYRMGRKIIVFSSIGSFEAAAARGFLRMGADVAIVFCPRDEEMRVSGRCRRNLTDEIHLGEDIFSQLEDVIEGSGGGHDAAAAANGKNKDIERIKSTIIQRLEEVFGKNMERL